MSITEGEMMAGREMELLEEAIWLEMGVSDLYLLFAHLLPVDRDFWWQLGVEEKNHAALLRAGINFLDAGIFPEELLMAGIEELKSINGKIRRMITDLQASPPSREEALRLALSLEDSAGESHYQLLMETRADSRASRLFQRLNEDDKDHSRRIRMYAVQRGFDLAG